MIFANDRILFARFRELYELRPYGLSENLLIVVFLDLAEIGRILPDIVFATFLPLLSRPGFKSI